MRKVRIALVLATILAAQPLFAEDMDMSSGGKACAAIAKACLSAGFARETPDKMFWQDCMKPILLDQPVLGVDVDAATVKTCRSNKIVELKKQLQEFEKISSKQTS
jgi:hypothetical protein